MISFDNNNSDYYFFLDEKDYFYKINESKNNDFPLSQDYDEEDNNNCGHILFEDYNRNCNNISLIPAEQNNNLGITGSTEQQTNDLLGRKTTREINYYEENIDLNEDKKETEELKKTQPKIEKNEKKNKKEKRNSKEKKQGRRRKDEINIEEEPRHDKFKEDNIMRKIKTFIFKYIHNILNDSLKYENYRFHPLNTNMNENLKKDFNEELLEKTIYEIYMTSSLNKRYENKNEEKNEFIEKIIRENEEKETISILNMKYKDILYQIRGKNLANFLENIKAKEKKNNEEFIISYMENVKTLLMDYEMWFKKKLGRNTSKNNQKID